MNNKGVNELKLCEFKIKNFRGYAGETVINFDDLTVFVGRNDVGKSTILEALDIFFYDGKHIIKQDKNDTNITQRTRDDLETCLTAVFTDLPDSIVIDAAHPTNLQSEYLLNADGNLEIVKKFSNGGTIKAFIKAIHPTNPLCADLLLKKNSELKTVVRDNSIKCDNLAVNSVLRAAIWQHFADCIKLAEVEIDASKEDAKKIADKLALFMPIYSLFQSDRSNSDGDGEIQDPLKEAVKQIIGSPEIQEKLDAIADQVKHTLEDVSSRTLEKLNEMDSSVARTLTPVIPETASLKWAEVFKSVSITGDDIPINKRGSGVKRIILLNFFRAEAEKRAAERNNAAVIYAIEEPETSQHTHNQQILIAALKALAAANNTQVILTTHSATVVKELDFGCLRLIEATEAGKDVNAVIPGSLCYPSLNEVNYLAFGEASIEYHDELYGFIMERQGMERYKAFCGEDTPYIKLRRNGTTQDEVLTITEFIRNRIHHPENTNNRDYTKEELIRSIQTMRSFIEEQKL